MEAPTLSIVMATGNPHKVEELSAIFAGLGLTRVRLLSLSEATPGKTLAEPAETGTSFEQNAQIKALSYAEQTGMLCLADDSGIEIDALGGKPGVISSHYCTDGIEKGMSRAQRDAANNARVMRELEGVPVERRGARFVCVMALAAAPGGGQHAPATSSGRVMVLVRGTFEGRIGLAGQVPRGENGFGYDPLFLVAPEFKFTGAEMPPEQKNKRSHRAKAAELMAAELRRFTIRELDTPSPP